MKNNYSKPTKAFSRDTISFVLRRSNVYITMNVKPNNVVYCLGSERDQSIRGNAAKQNKSVSQAQLRARVRSASAPKNVANRL